MKLSNVIAIARKQFLTLRHDRRTLALMLFAPVLAMLVFGYAFGTGPKHVKVVMVNLDDGTLGAQIVSRLDKESLDISYLHDADAARKQVDDGGEVAAISFTPGFSDDMKRGAAHIGLYLDSTNSQVASVVPQQLSAAVQSYAAGLGAKSPIAVDTDYAFPAAKNATYIDSFLPGIMAFAVTLFTILLTLLAFVGERVSGTLDRLRVTPVKESEIVLGYELAFGIIAAVQGTLMLLVALWVYHVLVVGSVFLAALIVILVAIDAQAIGILISAAAQREGQAVQFIPVIIFPVFLLSGIFLPLQSLPAWLLPIAYALPPTWGIQGLRDVMLRGWGMDQVWPVIAMLVGFAIVFTFLAVQGLKRARR